MNSTPILCLVVALFSLAGPTAAFSAEGPQEIVLWPNGAPGETGGFGAERDMTKPGEGLVAGKRVIRLGNVTNPTVTVYRPADGRGNGAAVLVCPGGGYSILALDLEGTEVCEWLNSIGVTAALLKYRVPGRPGRPNYAAPLQDAQRALGLVRSRAGEWGLETNRIGILGFSAGGHLSALASASFDKRTYDPIDAADQASCRPDFTVLIYPAYLAEKNNTDKVAPEVAPGAHMPPTFIAQTEDDSVGVDKTMTYAVALQKAKTPFELHIYPVGGHGYGLRPNGMAVTTWPKRAEEWMRSRGILGAN